MGQICMKMSASSVVRSPILPDFVGLHVKARTPFYPRTENKVQRQTVPDEYVPWKSNFPSYSPPDYTDAVVLKAHWADPLIGSPNFAPKFNQLDGNVNRRSFPGTYDVIDGFPRNPIGRTGLTGRGLLGRWGPNHAADPIVTRWKRGPDGAQILSEASRRPILEFVCILRGDCHEWAIPGGMVDPGEAVSATLKREFGEEALNSLKMTPERRKELEQGIENVFKSGQEIYAGYVDDPRNTDNAWIETTAVNFHDETGDVMNKIDLAAGDDAVGVQWRELSNDLRLYASHESMIKAVADFRKAHW